MWFSLGINFTTWILLVHINIATNLLHTSFPITEKSVFKNITVCKPIILSFEELDRKVNEKIIENWLEPPNPSQPSGSQLQTRCDNSTSPESLKLCIGCFVQKYILKKVWIRKNLKRTDQSRHRNSEFLSSSSPDLNSIRRRHRRDLNLWGKVKNLFGFGDKKSQTTGPYSTNDYLITGPPTDATSSVSSDFQDNENEFLKNTYSNDEALVSTLDLLKSYMSSPEVKTLVNPENPGGYLYNLSQELLHDLTKCRGVENCYLEFKNKLHKAEDILRQYKTARTNGIASDQISISTITNSISFIMKFLDVLTNCQGLESCHQKFKNIILQESSGTRNEPNFLTEIRRSLIEIIAVAFETEVGRNIKSVLTEWYRAGKNLLHVFKSFSEDDVDQVNSSDPRTFIDQETALEVIDRVHKPIITSTETGNKNLHEAKQFDDWITQSEKPKSIYLSGQDFNGPINAKLDMNKIVKFGRQKRYVKSVKKIRFSKLNRIKQVCPVCSNLPNQCRDVIYNKFNEYLSTINPKSRYQTKNITASNVGNLNGIEIDITYTLTGSEIHKVKYIIGDDEWMTSLAQNLSMSVLSVIDRKSKRLPI